jgi:hypothetical protein
MSDDDIRTIEDLEDSMDLIFHIWLICDMTIVDPIYLTGTKWYRYTRSDHDVVSRYLMHTPVRLELRYDRCELDDIGLLFELAVLDWESSCLGIPYTDFHSSNGVKKINEQSEFYFSERNAELRGVAS